MTDNRFNPTVIRMDEVETPQMSQDDWQHIAFDVFWDIVEQHGLSYAVTVFLTTLGTTAIDTDTVGELMGAMEATAQCAIEEKARGSATKH